MNVIKLFGQQTVHAYRANWFEFPVHVVPTGVPSVPQGSLVYVVMHICSLKRPLGRLS